MLRYNKATGQWQDADGREGRVALFEHDKEAVVLVSDWVAESDISDSGFAEAAADALFASIMDLDREMGGSFDADNKYLPGDLLRSPCISSVMAVVPW